jgi:protein TonB
LGSSLRADAGTSAAREGLRRRAAALVALALAACGAPTPPPEAPQQQSPVARAPATPPQAAAPKPEPARTPLDRYKRAVAQQILQANAKNTYDGIPPHLLRAVIVLQLTVDDKGAVTAVKTLRSPNAALTTVATKSVRAAGPLPAPPRELLRGGRLEFVETWLFRDDGKFQVRSVAEPQVAVTD